MLIGPSMGPSMRMNPMKYEPFLVHVFFTELIVLLFTQNGFQKLIMANRKGIFMAMPGLNTFAVDLESAPTFRTQAKFPVFRF